MNPQNTTFAKILSYLLHPLFLPTYTLLILFFSNRLSGFNIYSGEEAWKTNIELFLLIFIFTLVLPLSISLALKKAGKITSLEMETIEERRLPFMYTAISYILGFILIQREIGQSLNPFLMLVLVGAQFNIVLTLVISHFWKISIHMIGIGGLVGVSMLMMKLNMQWDNIFYLILFIAGLLAYARLKLEAHTPVQVLAGFVVGVLTEAVFLFA